MAYHSSSLNIPGAFVLQCACWAPSSTQYALRNFASILSARIRYSAAIVLLPNAASPARSATPPGANSSCSAAIRRSVNACHN